MRPFGCVRILRSLYKTITILPEVIGFRTRTRESSASSSTGLFFTSSRDCEHDRVITWTTIRRSRWPGCHISKELRIDGNGQCVDLSTATTDVLYDDDGVSYCLNDLYGFITKRLC